MEKLSGPIGTSALGWHPLEARLALGLHRDVNPWIFDLVDDAWEMVPGAKIDRGPGHEITFDPERDRWVEVTEFSLGTFRDGADGAMPNLVHEDEAIEYHGSRLVRDAALSPDGGLAVRRTSGNVYSVWGTRTGHLIPARIQYNHWRARVRFTGPDRLALMEPSGLVRVLDPYADHGGRSLPQPSIYRHENLSPWIGEGSRRGLYVRRMSEVSIESIDGTRTLVGRHGGSLDELVPSPDADLLAAHNGAGSMVVWDLAHPGRAPVSSHPIPFLRSVGFTPSGERLLTTSLISPVGLWDPRTLELRGTLDRVDVDRADAALPYIDGRKLATNPELPNEVTLTWDEFHALDDEYNPIVSSSGAGYLIADITETVVEWVDVDGSTVDLAAIVPVDDAPEAQWLDAVVHRDRVLVLADGTTYLIDPRMPGIVAAYEGEFTGAGGGAATIRTGSEVRLVRLVDGADLGRFEAGEDVAAVAPIDAARVAMLRRLDELRAVDIARGGEGVAVAISTTEIADIVVTPGEFAAVKLHSGEAIRVNLVTGDTSAATSEFLEEADVSRGARSWSKWVDIDPVDAERLPPHVRIALLNDDALGLPTRINENGIAAFERERFARIDTEGLTPIGARRIPVGIWGLSNGSSDRGFFGDDLFLMAWTQTESGFAPIVLEVGPSSMPPAEGDPGELMKEWSQRLSLRVTAEGRIEPITYEPR